MQKIDVKNPSGKYPIFIDDNLVVEFGRLVNDAIGSITRLVVVTDETVLRLWWNALRLSLENAGLATALVEVQSGEANKNLDTLREIYNRFLAFDLDTKGLVIAFGGGVVGDMAGFAAATYMRGVSLIQIPTTLLAMVDSSVGGKTAVDLEGGKNLVGVFKQPSAVFVDPTFLTTLPKEEISCGMAEVLKHGIIGDKDLFEMIEAGQTTGFKALINRAVRVKAQVVERDPFEKGERAQLNLGHTFGHALELLSNYKLAHGKAVGIGLAASAALGAYMGKCDPSLATRIEQAVKANGLSGDIFGYTAEQIVNAMRHDKKKQGVLRFVVPREIGKVEVVSDVPKEALDKALARIIRPLTEH